MTTPRDDDERERVDSETPPSDPDNTRADEAAAGLSPAEQETTSPGEDPGDLPLGTSREDLT
jgi:hypothetical protein